ncbi:hAT family dimerization domain protein [Fusarium oxysporum f. sp. phaseoli]
MPRLAINSTMWVWQHGFYIQARDSPTKRKWVCKHCLRRVGSKVADFTAVGTPNIEKHLIREHRLVDESGRRKPPALWKGKQEKTRPEYKPLPTLSNSDEEPPFKRLKAMSRCSWESPRSRSQDEYDHWLSSADSKNDTLVTDPIQYWWERRRDYPRLSRMALDLLSVPSMSAECERLFGVAEQMVPPLRTRLEASTIGIAQTLRSWVRNGLVDAADSLTDVSEEVGSSIIWETEEDGRDAGE